MWIRCETCSLSVQRNNVGPDCVWPPAPLQEEGWHHTCHYRRCSRWTNISYGNVARSHELRPWDRQTLGKHSPASLITWPQHRRGSPAWPWLQGNVTKSPVTLTPYLENRAEPMPHRTVTKIKSQIAHRVLSDHLLFLEIESNDDFFTLWGCRDRFVSWGKGNFHFCWGKMHIKVGVPLSFNGYQHSIYYVPVAALNILQIRTY